MKVQVSSINNRLKKINIGEYTWRLLRGVLIIGLVFIILYPILIKISMSVMTREDLIDGSVKWIPRNFNLSQTIYNWSQVWEHIRYPVALRNTLILVLTISILQLMACTVIGYGFARFEFKGKSFWFALVILTLLVPPSMIMVPLYLNFRFFNLYGLLGEEGINIINSYWPLVFMSLTGLGLRNGLFIYIMRQFFKGMPSNLEEAALVDGAGYLKTFVRVMIPGAGPVLVTVFLFSFVWGWNDDFYTSILLPQADILVSTLQRLWQPHIFQGHLSRYNLMMRNIGMLLFMAPVLALFAFMQRYFIESVQRTGIVG